MKVFWRTETEFNSTRGGAEDENCHISASTVLNHQCCPVSHFSSVVICRHLPPVLRGVSPMQQQLLSVRLRHVWFVLLSTNSNSSDPLVSFVFCLVLEFAKLCCIFVLFLWHGLCRCVHVPRTLSFHRLYPYICVFLFYFMFRCLTGLTFSDHKTVAH